MENVVILEKYSGKDKIKASIIDGKNELRNKGGIKFEELGANIKIADLVRLNNLSHLDQALHMIKSGIIDIVDEYWGLENIIDNTGIEKFLRFLYDENLYNKKDFVYTLKSHLNWNDICFYTQILDDDINLFNEYIIPKQWILLNKKIAEEQIKEYLKNKKMSPYDLTNLELRSDTKYTKTFLSRYKKYLFNFKNVDKLSSKPFDFVSISFILDNLELFDIEVLVSSYDTEYYKDFDKLYNKLLDMRISINFESLYTLKNFIKGLLDIASKAPFSYTFGNITITYSDMAINNIFKILNTVILPHFKPYAFRWFLDAIKSKDKTLIQNVILNEINDLYLVMVYDKYLPSNFKDALKSNNFTYYNKIKLTGKELFGCDLKFEVDRPTKVKLGELGKMLQDQNTNSHIIEFEKDKKYTILDIINLTSDKEYELKLQVYDTLIKNVPSLSPKVYINNRFESICRFL